MKYMIKVDCLFHFKFFSVSFEIDSIVLERKSKKLSKYLYQYYEKRSSIDFIKYN